MIKKLMFNKLKFWFITQNGPGTQNVYAGFETIGKVKFNLINFRNTFSADCFVNL